jgi:hypothetical protein
MTPENNTVTLHFIGFPDSNDEIIPAALGLCLRVGGRGWVG